MKKQIVTMAYYFTVQPIYWIFGFSRVPIIWTKNDLLYPVNKLYFHPPPPSFFLTSRSPKTFPFQNSISFSEPQHLNCNATYNISMYMKQWLHEFHIFEQRDEDIDAEKFITVCNLCSCKKKGFKKIRLAGIHCHPDLCHTGAVL